MKEMDRECKRLADIQTELFEVSVKKLEMSSEVFVRRYMNCELHREFIPDVVHYISVSGMAHI